MPQCSIKIQFRLLYSDERRDCGDERASRRMTFGAVTSGTGDTSARGDTSGADVTSPPDLHTMPHITSLSRSPTHTFSKICVPELELLEGLGVAGDAHMGARVKHRSRVAQNPDQPNLRQVHLIHNELLDELATKGFDITPGAMGENILTTGIQLLELPLNTELQLGEQALIRITGLRNPCAQLDGLAPGLMKALLHRDTDGNLILKGGIMAIVLRSGTIRTGDDIRIRLPEPPYIALDRV